MSKYRYQYQGVEPESVSRLFQLAAKKTVDSEMKPVVLMVGMHLTKTRGGITTLTAGILNSALTDDYDFVYLASQAEDFGKIGKVLLAFTAAARFVVICLLRRPVLIYVHVGSNASLYRESVFILLAKLLRKRVLSHFHAGDIENYYPNQPNLGKRFIRLALGLSDRVIAVSHESVPRIRGIVPTLKISVIPNAIDTSIFHPRPDLSREPFQAATVRLLFVGAVGKLKGEKDLLKALAILRDGEPNLKATLIGYGAENLADYCKELGVSGQIEHLGHVSMEERLAMFEKSDIFVLPTYAEAMPISVIEAMAAGLAIVSTPVGGIPRLIQNGKEGLLVPSGNVEALAQAISFLVNNKKKRLEMGSNARRKALCQMDFGTYIERLRTEMIVLSKPGTNI